MITIQLLYRHTENPEKIKRQILDLVNYKYRSLLSALIDEFIEGKGVFNINHLIEPDEEGWIIIENITNGLNYYGDFGCDFDDRYREDCLRQELRKVFYNTLCIIENDFCMYKINHFKIVGVGTIITEEDWERSRKKSKIGKDNLKWKD